MNAPMEALLVALILSDLALLGSGRLGSCIRTVALQGILAGLLPLAEGGAGFQILLLGATVVVLKGFVFPRLLGRAMRESATSREVQPLVGYAPSLLAGVAILAGAFWLDGRMGGLLRSSGGILVPVAFSMMFTGLFLVVARRTAVNQVIGYLVLENGIYAFSLAAAREIPFLVELGVLMDLFVAVFVMGIAIQRINLEFDHIDSGRLTRLRG